MVASPHLRYSRLNERERVVGRAAAAERHGCKEQLKGDMGSGVAGAGMSLSAGLGVLDQARGALT
jgi:hypothetical protein